MGTTSSVRRPGGVWAVLAIAILLSGCRDPLPEDGDGRPIFRIGYMPNLTHAPALYGIESGLFEEALGSEVSVRVKAFTAGPSVVEAIFAGELDVAYLGPNPALNAHFVSRGEALRIIAGSTAGGVQLIVRPTIDEAHDLLGKRLATPALANTQDIAARVWLEGKGIEVGKGDHEVEVLPIPPAEVLRLFSQGEVVAAWMPEPWASRLVVESGGRVLVDEASLWPDGRFPTTVVAASLPALETRRHLIARFLRAHRLAIARLASQDARRLVSRRVERDLGFTLPPAVVERAYRSLEFTIDPMPDALLEQAERAQQVGYLPRVEGALEALDTNL